MSATAPNVVPIDPMLSVAIGLADNYGFRVFPLRKDRKLPLLKGWKEAATSDAFTLLNDWPKGCCPGIATGWDFTIIDVEAAGLANDPTVLRLPPTLTIETASGGEHYIYRTPAGQKFANSVKKIAPHTDVRGEGGLAVGAGGRVQDPKTGEIRWYRIKRDLPIADLPPYLAELMRAAPQRAPDAGKALCDLDTPAAIERAQAYLADASSRGPGRNVLPGGRGTAAYKATARLGDFGISPALAYELLQPWNETSCTPPQDDDELAKCVEHAFAYRQDPLGRDHPLRHFDEITPAPPPAAAPRTIRATPFQWREAATIEPRDWLYGHHLIRKFLSATVAPGGMGKTQLIIAERLALATGRPLLGEATKRCKVWYWNGEDPRDELDRRFLATCLHYGISQADLEGRLFVDSGRDTPIVIAREERAGLVIAEPVVAAVIAAIKENGIDVFTVDPFVSSHEVSENDNAKINAVARQWAAIADECNCAIELVHHVRKTGGAEITVEDARGASALHDAARSMRALNRMSDDEAKKAGMTTRSSTFARTMPATRPR